MTSDKQSRRLNAGPHFLENIALLPPITDIDHIDLIDPTGRLETRILNKEGQRGAMAICQYLLPLFGRLDRDAAAHGVHFFGEAYVADARAHPGAHRNIDRFLAIIAGAPTLDIVIARRQA
ncbi:hypothetical protein WM40_21815 [Robbsia andropogonis]|uniref:DUF2322 family protein n=2 Tax=Robbsia andropogonis TaxID=28092 RepID=A0A0F5JVI8_9BURK|nr:hypothetical protein WM40_21815 [Robbsia andropogonis]